MLDKLACAESTVNNQFVGPQLQVAMAEIISCRARLTELSCLQFATAVVMDNELVSHLAYTIYLYSIYFTISIYIYIYIHMLMLK